VRVTACQPGFSGASVWRVDRAGERFALRAWPPEHPTAEGLALIHRVLAHVRSSGFLLTPSALSTLRGTTFTSREVRLWEMTTWMSGAGDYAAKPSLPRLRAACQALAEFHVASSSFPQGSPQREQGFEQPSAGIAGRRDMLDRLLQSGADRLRGAIATGDWPECAERGRRILDLFSLAARPVAARLNSACDVRTSQQFCLRDIKADHVLFEGDRVTGLIDFGAMRMECVSGDIARLLGGMAADDPALWREGLAAYESKRPLTQAERELISIFDESGVLLSGIHWLNWIYLDGRTFPDRGAVISRLDELLVRLERLAAK
jgi:homoserine kinase type II